MDFVCGHASQLHVIPSRPRTRNPPKALPTNLVSFDLRSADAS